MKPVILIVLDGVGHNENPKGNAVLAAHTPNLDAYKEKYPWILLDASGEAVGLPPGFQGSSEVGHLSMGAGRIIVQELKRINDQLVDGSLFKSPVWNHLIENWRSNQSQLHFLGLLQDEGVHSHQDHLFKFMHRARNEYPEGKIIIHPFLDGNGRIGRLLITLYLIDKGILQQPLLYLSEFFERNKRLYYDNLILVREQNNLVQWLKYFLVGIDQTAKRASDTLAAILKLKENTEDMLRKNGGRRTDSALTLLNHLFTDPVIRIKDAENICNLTKKSANALIQLMAEMNILKEISGKTRNRIYLFKEYLDLFR